MIRPGVVQLNSKGEYVQLHDLMGDVVATAAANEAATKPSTTYNSTEYGVSVNGKPPPYSWLGALGQLTELPTGATTSGGDGYVPQLGCSLQTEVVTPPGACPNSAYAGAVYTTSLESWVTESADTWGSGGAEREAGRLAAARKEAEEAEGRARADEPGVVPIPGEGGPEVDDPKGLASYNEALERAKQLRGDAENTEAFGLFCSLAPPGWDAFCGAGAAVWAATLEGSARALEECVALGRATPGYAGKYGMCFINESRTPSVLGVSLPLVATATACLYEPRRKKQRAGVNDYNCEGHREVTGPLWRDR